jgi:hypothetical protein
MATITAKILSATTDEKGISTIVIEFDGGNGKWKKEYKQSQELIKAAEFKNMVIADIRRDLKVDTKLIELEPLVNKTFTFKV